MFSQRKRPIVQILIISFYFEQNSLNYDSIGQFEALNRRVTEVPKQLLTFYLCQ